MTAAKISGYIHLNFGMILADQKEKGYDETMSLLQEHFNACVAQLVDAHTEAKVKAFAKKLDDFVGKQRPLDPKIAQIIVNRMNDLLENSGYYYYTENEPKPSKGIMRKSPRSADEGKGWELKDSEHWDRELVKNDGPYIPPVQQHRDAEEIRQFNEAAAKQAKQTKVYKDANSPCSDSPEATGVLGGALAAAIIECMKDEDKKIRRKSVKKTAE